MAVASRDGDPTMRSNKTSWADWLRFVYDELSTDSPTYDFIRASDYAELVSVLFGVDVSDAAISKVLRGE
ncbi:MAG: hypothetical protein KDA51_06630 [Planctomycetales bacterium]|nr:hypothetical protein [Planctomycetales bacterium]